MASKSPVTSPSAPKKIKLSSPQSPTSAAMTQEANVANNNGSNAAGPSTPVYPASAFLVQRDPEHPKAQLPTRGSALAAGYDLYSSETVTLPGRGGRKVVQTGIRMKIPDGCYGRVAPRSGLGGLL